MAIATGTAIALAGGAALVGGLLSAKGQQQTAQAQMDAARAQQGSALSYAMPTAEELDLLQRQSQWYQDSLAYQRQDIQLQNSLLQNYLAQQQTAASGGNPEILKPMQDQFALERQQLNSRLRAVGGSGYGESSAGLQQQAFQGLAQGQARMNAVSGLAGLAGQAQTMRNQNIGLGSDLAQSLFAQRGSIQARQANAINSVPAYQYAGAGGLLSSSFGAALSGAGNNLGQYGMISSIYGNRNPGQQAAPGPMDYTPKYRPELNDTEQG